MKVPKIVPVAGKVKEVSAPDQENRLSVLRRNRVNETGLWRDARGECPGWHKEDLVEYASHG